MNWTCPHCDRAQTIVKGKRYHDERKISIEGLAEGLVASVITAVGCANDECRRLTLTVAVRPAEYINLDFTVDYETEELAFRRLIPDSAARVYPDYIPSALREDYQEACLIRDDSPKAAATLARRCLQGMIRDFASVTEKTLYREVQVLREKLDAGTAPQGVTIESLDAIDHVRKVGNIGAHMEADINLIVPVDPGEAQVLIGLIEMLFDEWYVGRHRREQRLAELALLAAEKQAFIASGGTGAESPTSEGTQ